MVRPEVRDQGEAKFTLFMIVLLRELASFVMPVLIPSERNNALSTDILGT